MKIPFDATKRPEIEAGKYRVETRDGRSVRIVCWDAKISGGTNKPILALFQDNEGEELCLLFENGRVWQSYDTPSDLLLVSDEPELTEFEQAVRRTMRQYYSPGQAEDETVKQVASELLALARKEIMKREAEIFSRYQPRKTSEG